MIFLLKYILGLIFQWGHFLKIIISIVLASGFFFISFYRRIGDYFTFNIFMVRFLAGISLGILYCTRGFGITAWTHSL